ncbi:MAG: oligoendopeptidase F [Janthinobacterium lividum]
MPETLPKRQDVPNEKTWNVESVFPSVEIWEEEFTRVGGLLEGFAEYAGHLGDSAATLAAALARRTEVGMATRKLGLYAGMLRSGDSGDQAAAALSSRAGGLGARFASATAFYEPELLALDPGKLLAWVNETPELIVYAHYFDTLARRRDHVRSEEVEALLAQVSEPLSALGTASGVLTDADLKFAPITDSAGVTHEVAQGTIADLLRHEDQTVRKAAWESYADGHLSVKNTLAACLSGRVKQSVFSSRARRYPSALEASLAPNAIPREVFDTLLSTFQANLPIWHRYWGLLKKGLGVETLYCCDIPADTVPAPMPKSETPISFAAATETICTGMAPLGPDYVSAMRRGLSEDRWVDGVPNIGKGSGAFSSGMPGTSPFIMMNYRDDLFSVSTLAHELGHSMHSYLTWQNQPPIYSGYSLFVAEVASNFDQALVRGHLLDTTTDRDSVLAIIEEAISNFHRYLFVMPTLARFELDCHEKIERGEALTADGMGATLAGFFREGYGGQVEIDEARLGITWAEFRHLYSPFYVYQYATGISAANALAEDVRTEGAPAAERYLNFLKAGGSLYPLDALKLAGIDMTSPEPIQRAFGVLSKMVDRLAEIVEE